MLFVYHSEGITGVNGRMMHGIDNADINITVSIFNLDSAAKHV